jgi:hypothetical protein
VGILKSTKLNQEEVQMKIKQIASNMTVLDLGFAQVFFSYETPVAACLTDGSLVRTETKYSVTTTKHINKWLNGCEALTVPQDRIDCLLTSSSECSPDYDEVA